MRYKIEIITYESGKVGYFVKRRAGFGWRYINTRPRGFGSDPEVIPYRRREDAIAAIDQDYRDYLNKKIKSIGFQYINKP